MLSIPRTVIDNKLNWEPHVEHLRKKLRSMTGAICRIRHSIPKELYLKLYNSLLESHLNYGITVWGVVIKERPHDRLFVTQKHCIRILFGDLDAYLDKQSTCARTREYGMQRLDQRYYKKEHTKPIFSRLKIMTIHNLFKYHCINEFYKIIKYRVPYTLFECINTSNRDTSNNVILSVKSNTFLHLAAKFWNSVHKRIITPGKGLETSLGLVKSRMRDIILQFQSTDIPDTWTPSNFQL